MLDPYRRDTETHTDALIKQGDFPVAETRLRESVDYLYMKGTNPDDFYRVGLKYIALPFYQQVHAVMRGQIEIAVTKETEEIYGLVGNLLETAVVEMTSLRSDKAEEKKSLKGIIGELAIYALLTRIHLGNPKILPVPTSFVRDYYAAHLAADIVVFEPTCEDQKLTETFIQVKGWRDEGAKYSPSILILSSKDLYVNDDATSPASLMATIMRELNGTATDIDHNTLNAVSKRLLEKLNQHKQLAKPKHKKLRNVS